MSTEISNKAYEVTHVADKIKEVLEVTGDDLDAFKASFLEKVDKEKITQVLTDAKNQIDAGTSMQEVYTTKGGGLIIALQLALQTVTSSAIQIDGMYGENTKGAVQDFQTERNKANPEQDQLGEDGWAGAKTLTALIDYYTNNKTLTIATPTPVQKSETPPQAPVKKSVDKDPPYTSPAYEKAKGVLGNLENKQDIVLENLGLNDTDLAHLLQTYRTIFKQAHTAGLRKQQHHQDGVTG